MANQTYQLVVTGNSAGQFVQNIFHYRLDDDSYTTRLLSAKGLIDGWLAADRHESFLAMCPDTYILKSVKARRVTNGGGPEWVDVSQDGEEGTGGSGLQASANGPVIIWNTDGGARRVGKTFISGIAKANINAGEIKEDFLADLITAAGDYRQSFSAVGGATPTCTFCIPRSNDLSTRSLVVDVQVSRYLGQQRRRNLPV